MAADDERRAEIEAATDALLADSGLPRYGGHRATVERRMAIAFEAADRVRDARGDESRCTRGSMAVIDASRHDETCWRRLWVENVRDAARSPQGEGHEALEAVARSHDNCCSPELRHKAREALRLGPCEPEQGCPFCSERPNRYARVSPSRDGTVAAEDRERDMVRRIVAALREPQVDLERVYRHSAFGSTAAFPNEIQRTQGEKDLGAIADWIELEFLAEFSRPEQPEPDALGGQNADDG